MGGYSPIDPELNEICHRVSYGAAFVSSAGVTASMNAT